jgi:hypothetical protein
VLLDCATFLGKLVLLFLGSENHQLLQIGDLMNPHHNYAHRVNMEFRARFKTLTGRQVGLLMVSFTLTMPFMMLPSGSYGTPGVNFRGYAFAAMMWGFGVYNSGVVFQGPDILSLIIGSPLLLFAYFIQRYCLGKSSWKTPVLIGFFITVVYSILFSPSILGWLEYGASVYSGPLPITVILGLVLMRLVGAPQIDRPFDNQAGPSSWWEKQQQT